MKKQTLAIHTPYAHPDAYGSLAVPIYSNVSFEFKDAQEIPLQGHSPQLVQDYEC
jgi:O-acetylhomoserine (thiol)-lyase